MTEFSMTISAFLATYFIHSTVFIVLVLVAIKLRKVQSDLLGELLLKGAFVIGLFTAGLQTSGLVQIPQLSDYGWNLSLPQSTLATQPASQPHDQVGHGQQTPKVVQNSAQKTYLPQPSYEPEKIIESGFSWLQLLTWGWLFGALLTLILKARQFRFLKQTLHHRYPLTDAEIIDGFAQLKPKTGIKRPVALTQSDCLDSPIALSRHEIVMPEGFAENHSKEHIIAALAHELAHIKRADNLWLNFSNALQSLLFFQPLNRLITDHIYQLAEQRSDALAARWTGNPRALAETLSAVAERKHFVHSTTWVPAMTSKKSNLLSRVENLILNRNKKTASVSLFVSALVCAVVLMATPAITIENASAEGQHQRHMTEISIEDNGHKNMSITSRSDDLHFKLKTKLRGDLRFDEDETRIISFPTHSSFDLTYDDHSEKHRLRIKSGSGDPVYTYYYDGDKQPYDADAQAWFASVIPEILRKTGLDAYARVHRIHESRGADAVLDEVDLITSDHVKSLYLKHLFELTQLNDNDLSRAITQTEDISSDFEQSNTLNRLVKSQDLQGENLWLEAIEATEEIQSDFEQAKTLMYFSNHLPQTSNIHEAFFAASDNIQSDFEMRKTFAHYLKNKPDQSINLINMFAAAKRIQSDFELSQLLISAKDQMTQSPELFDAYIDLAETIQSDFEMRKTYAQLLQHNIDNANLKRMIISAENEISSDFELAGLLVEVMDQYNLDEELVDTIKDATDSIQSDFERDRVIRGLFDQS
ncbi:M56 family metallopeptidase [Marinicella sp. W31]|uniref:M56 family metallopeptidase n=1 Tax=Marinicella sp. W31 TaxID=3023713 RepID=UPI003757B23B